MSTIDKPRRTRFLQPLRGGLGPRDGHPVPVDKTVRWPHTGAAPATGTIVHRPRGDHRHGQFVTSSTTSSTSPTILEAAGIPEPLCSSAACNSTHRGAPACCTRSTTHRPPIVMKPSTSKCWATRGIYHRRLDGGDQTPERRGCWWARTSRPSTTTCGNCATAPTGAPGSTHRKTCRQLHELQRLWLIGHPHNVLPLNDVTPPAE